MKIVTPCCQGNWETLEFWFFKNIHTVYCRICNPDKPHNKGSGIFNYSDLEKKEEDGNK